MDFKIRFIKKTELKKLIQFNKRNYGTKHILVNKKYLDLQFGCFPSAKNCYTILGIFNPKEYLLGILGMTFLDYLYFGKKVKCTSFANLMIQENLRNLGLGYLLIQKAENINPICLDHGVNDHAMSLFKGMVWVKEDMKKYSFVFNSENIKKIIKKKNAKIKDSILPHIESDNMEFISLRKYDKRLSQLFKNTAKKYSITVDRSCNYLNWRYFNHPMIKYNIFATVKNNTIKSFLVVRIDGPKDFRVARIIDFVSTDNAEKFTFMQVIEFCKSKKVNFIDYFFSGNVHLKNLKICGFRDCLKADYDLLPKLLNPIVSSKNNSINFVVKTNHSLKYKKVNNIKNWYTTKAGGDQDRAY